MIPSINLLTIMVSWSNKTNTNTMKITCRIRMGPSRSVDMCICNICSPLPRSNYKFLGIIAKTSNLFSLQVYFLMSDLSLILMKIGITKINMFSISSYFKCDEYKLRYSSS